MRAPLQRRFGRALRDFRSAAGFSQENFARHIGIHRTAMGTLERGLGNPTLETIERIAEGLGIRPSQLLRAAETYGAPARRGQTQRKGRATKLGAAASVASRLIKAS
jgi:transcriptional regulator with XRE-family HTH domain